MHQDPELAAALAALALGQEVPEEMWTAVAEVLAWAYSARGTRQLPRTGDEGMGSGPDTGRVRQFRPASSGVRPAMKPADHRPAASASPRRRRSRSGASTSAPVIVQVRNRLVMTFAPLVKYIVFKKVRELPARCEVEDFISCGLEALIASIDRYDPAKGATLEQFAWTRIHGAVLDELRRQDWAPRSLRRWERDIAQGARAVHRPPRPPPDARGARRRRSRSRSRTCAAARTTSPSPTSRRSTRS